MTDGLVTDCIFSRIVAGRAPADVVAQDDEFIAFRDAHPIAPVYLLAVPRRHVALLDEIDELEAAVAGRMLRFVAAAAREAGMQQSGHRVISDIGRDAGQMVDHLHWHIVGGRRSGSIG
jgi:histidine triad (HIT) family protein